MVAFGAGAGAGAGAGLSPSPSAPLAPRVTVVDGCIVVDAASLMVPAMASAPAPELTRVEEAGGAKLNSRTCVPPLFGPLPPLF